MAKSKGCGCFPVLLLLGASGYGGYYLYEQYQDNVATAEIEEQNKANDLQQAKEQAQRVIEELAVARKAEADARAELDAAIQAEAEAKKEAETARGELESAGKEIEQYKAEIAELKQELSKKSSEVPSTAIPQEPAPSNNTKPAAENEPNDNELTGLIQALQAKEYSTEVEKLYQKRLLNILPRIAAGEDVNTILENANGTTALHNACGLGEFDIVIWLIQHGADINIKTAKGASVADCIGNDPNDNIRSVIMSLEAEQEESEDLALEELSGILERITAMKVTSSNKLYRTRLLTLLPMILEGADVNLTLPETKGNTALHYACGLGDVELVTWLLQNGANPNKLTDKGMSPYKCAGGDQVKKIQSLIINHGGTPEVVSQSRRSR